uniref:3-phosphoshikimate 1-carboxyvinyltransferase n=1 Tax=Zeugodacus cucurbitae TaxID=28588 RepID=A0A0A1WSW4_ZEUCU
MKLSVVLLILKFGATLLLLTQASPYSPWLTTQNHGPLYEGVQLLVSDAKFQAELTWNETEFQLLEAVTAMQGTQTLLDDYEPLIEERLNARLLATRSNNAYQHCYLQHDYAIETFEQELTLKLQRCRAKLTQSLTVLQDESNSELNFIRDAAAEARDVLEICNVVELKGRESDSDHAGITMCVISRVGALDQHLSAAAESFLDLLATEVSADDAAEHEGNSCEAFEELRQLFDTVYADISECVGEWDA